MEGGGEVSALLHCFTSEALPQSCLVASKVEAMAEHPGSAGTTTNTTPDLGGSGSSGGGKWGSLPSVPLFAPPTPSPAAAPHEGGTGGPRVRQGSLLLFSRDAQGRLHATALTPAPAAAAAAAAAAGAADPAAGLPAAPAAAASIPGQRHPHGQPQQPQPPQQQQEQHPAASVPLLRGGEPLHSQPLCEGLMSVFLGEPPVCKKAKVSGWVGGWGRGCWLDVACEGLLALPHAWLQVRSSRPEQAWLTCPKCHPPPLPALISLPAFIAVLSPPDLLTSLTNIAHAGGSSGHAAADGWEPRGGDGGRAYGAFLYPPPRAAHRVQRQRGVYAAPALMCRLLLYTGTLIYDPTAWSGSSSLW